jgi:hypothetical protein
LHVIWQKGEELRRACVYPDSHIVEGLRRTVRLLQERTFNSAILALDMRGSELHFACIGNGRWYNPDSGQLEWTIDTEIATATEEFRGRTPVYIISDAKEAWHKFNWDVFQNQILPDLTISHLPSSTKRDYYLRTYR